MEISPDAIVFWRWGVVSLNATILFTWIVMALMAAVSWLVTRKLAEGTKLTRWQNLLEVLVTGIEGQIRDVSHQEPRLFLPFVGTLFLFIALSNLLSIVPGYLPPTGSLSTTTSLALSVFIAVPFFGFSKQGGKGYLRHYITPSIFMLPFNIMGELSRTVALAVRLFGNVMSGTMIVAILLSIVPLLFPVVMQLLGLLVGLIQAYIFAVLAMVYVASATQTYHEKELEKNKKGDK
ncbi:MAG: F0F1 ATP synthase subunit A [Proteobacteria bacterium]|nr:F0F1 ATP synthase subunit A [Pseudomonadota bacterium]